MEKLVCESLEEYYLLEAESGGNFLQRTGKAAITYPGRLLRSIRAKGVMGKYKNAMTKKVDVLMQKYFNSFKQFVSKIENKIQMIEKQNVDDAAKIKQKEELVQDLDKALTRIISQMQTGVENIIKIYADNFAQRVERKGTLTGVEFMPEEKTALQADWQSMEQGVHQHIQEETLKLIDDIKLDALSSIKAKLESEIEAHKYQTRSLWGAGKGSKRKSVTDDPSNISKLGKAGEEFDAYSYLKNLYTSTFKQNFELDKIYSIKNSNIFPDANNTYTKVKFKIDNDAKKLAYRFYQVNSIGKESLADENYYYLVRDGEDEAIIEQRIDTAIKGLK